MFVELMLRARKDFNRWLPEDISTRRGVSGCNLSGRPAPAWEPQTVTITDPQDWALVTELLGGMRAMRAFAERHGVPWEDPSDDRRLATEIRAEARGPRCGCGHEPHPGLVCGWPLPYAEKDGRIIDGVRCGCEG